jgi:hypothetical protein
VDLVPIWLKVLLLQKMRKSLAVLEQVVEATHFGWQVIPQGWVVVAAIRYHWYQNYLEY